MIKQLLNSVIAKYRDLSVSIIDQPLASANNNIDLLATNHDILLTLVQ